MIGIALRSLGSWSGKRKSLENNAGDEEEEGLAKGHSLHSAQEDVSRCTSWTRMALHLISGHEGHLIGQIHCVRHNYRLGDDDGISGAGKRGVHGCASQVTAALVHFFTVPTGSHSDISLPVKELGRGVLNRTCGRRREESLGEERDRSRSRTLGLIRSGAGRGIPRPLPLLAKYYKLPLLYLPSANYLLVTRVSNQKMRSLFLLQHCLWVRGIFCQFGF